MSLSLRSLSEETLMLRCSMRPQRLAKRMKRDFSSNTAKARLTATAPESVSADRENALRKPLTAVNPILEPWLRFTAIDPAFADRLSLRCGVHALVPRKESFE